MPVTNPTDAGDTAHSAIIVDHPFEPKNPGQPWGLCQHCNLAAATHQDTIEAYKSDAPKAPPPVIPPNARPVEKKESEPPEALPVSTAESMSEPTYHEHAVHPISKDSCWRCGKTSGVRQNLTNGAWLCEPCEEILKP